MEAGCIVLPVASSTMARSSLSNGIVTAADPSLSLRKGSDLILHLVMGV
jgi:hypothetical protein